MFQLTIENRENYGTLSTDWRNDILKKKSPLIGAFFIKVLISLIIISGNNDF
jgi:hypothetical protein